MARNRERAGSEGTGPGPDLHPVVWFFKWFVVLEVSVTSCKSWLISSLNRPRRFRFKEMLQNSALPSQKHRSPAVGVARSESEKNSGCWVVQVWRALGRHPSLLTALPLHPLSFLKLSKVSGSKCWQLIFGVESFLLQQIFELEPPPYSPVFFADGGWGIGTCPLCQGVFAAYSSITSSFPLPRQDLKRGFKYL